MNRYILKIAEINVLEKGKPLPEHLKQKKVLDDGKKYIDHPTHSAQDNLLETEEAARIAGPG